MLYFLHLFSFVLAFENEKVAHLSIFLQLLIFVFQRINWNEMKLKNKELNYFLMKSELMMKNERLFFYFQLSTCDNIVRHRRDCLVCSCISRSKSSYRCSSNRDPNRTDYYLNRSFYLIWIIKKFSFYCYIFEQREIFINIYSFIKKGERENVLCLYVYINLEFKVSVYISFNYYKIRGGDFFSVIKMYSHASLSICWCSWLNLVDLRMIV